MCTTEFVQPFVNRCV